jgi:hypothetical protein
VPAKKRISLFFFKKKKEDWHGNTNKRKFQKINKMAENKKKATMEFGKKWHGNQR